MDNIDNLYKEWQSLQPLKPEDQKRLDQKFMLDFNFNSNHIEGNTLTYGQTKLLFIFGETTGNASLRDWQEMKAHNVGLEMIKREALDKERPLSEAFIRELNHTILVENFWKNAKTPSGETTRMEVQIGVYKTRQNSVITATGVVFEYASPEETPAMMTDLVSWYNEEERKGELSPMALAALLHYRYIRIHPFEDGNGRIARLLVNYVLHRHGYPMIVIRSDKEHKDEYLLLLHQCDVEVGLLASDGALASLEQIQPFVTYMESQLQRALEISIKAAKGESIEEDDDFVKRITLLEREAKQKTAKQNAKPKLDRTQVWNVLEFCYFPIAQKLQKELEPAEKFFSYRMGGDNRISKTTHALGGLHLNSVLRDTQDFQTEEFLSQAKSMHYNYQLEYPNPEYNMGNLSIHISFDIQFEKDYYTLSCLNNKSFDYETYPTEKEIESIVSYFKNEVLTKIEEAINNPK